MTYSVPRYTEISHFRAPYKDSLMGLGRSEEFDVEDEVFLAPRTAPVTTRAPAPASSSMPVYASATAPVYASPSPVTTRAPAPPKQPSPLPVTSPVTTRAPAVVSASSPGYAVAAQTPSSLKPIKLTPSFVAAFLAKQKKSAAKKPLRILPTADIQKNVVYFLSELDKQAKAVFKSKGVAPNWDELQRQKLAILIDRKSAWHKTFKLQIAKLLRGHSAYQAKLFASAIVKAAKKESMGYTADLPGIKVPGRLLFGPAGRVFPTKPEAAKFFAKTETKTYFIQVFGITVSKFWKSTTKVPPLKVASAWSRWGDPIAKLSLDADVLEMEKLHRFQIVAAAMKGVIEKKKSAIYQVVPAAQKEALTVVVDAKKDLEKADAELKAALKRAEAELEAAKQDNQSLKVLIEDLKSFTAREELAPQFYVPPPAPPAVPVPQDSLPVPLNDKGEVPNPDKLVATGDSLKAQTEVEADIVAAGLDKPNYLHYLPYLVGAGALAAVAVIASRPRTATPNKVKGPYDSTYHRDGTLTYWNVYKQKWERGRDIPDHILATFDAKDRARTLKHISR